MARGDSGTVVCLPFFCSHLLVPIIVTVWILYMFVRLNFERVLAYDSAALSLPWNYTAPPFYQTLIADLHHTNINPARTLLLEVQLSNITQKFNPPIVSLAGDLVDSLNDTFIASFHRQYEDNWKRYNATRVFSELFSENRTIFELAGNHDMMVVSIDDTIRNRYRNYTIRPINDPFGVRSYIIGGYSVPIKYHLYNPLRAPFTSGPMGVFPCHIWDDVEALDAAIDDNYRNVIVTHFPMNQVWSINKTGTGRGIREVVRRADLYLAGHLHPKTNEITRRGTALSITVTAFFETSTFVMPFIDNGGAGVLPVDTHSENVVLITYPLEKAHLTQRSVFNLTAFPIRVLSFSESPLFLPVYIDGAYVGQMVYIALLRRNNHFYSLNVSGLRPGDHLLKVGTTELNFFIGSTTELTYEWANILYCPDSCIFGCFGFFLHILIYVLPWWGTISDVLDNFADVMFANPTYTPLTWYEMLVIGPLYQFSRLRRAPGTIYAYCVFTGVMFALFHMYTMKMDNGIDDPPMEARAFIWGVYFGDGSFHQYAMLATLLLVYEIFFILPAINFIGFWFERDPKYSWNCAQLACAGILIFVMLVGFVGLGVLMYLAGGWETVMTAPVMLVMVLTLLVVFFGLPGVTKRQLAKKERQELAKQQAVTLDTL